VGIRQAQPMPAMCPGTTRRIAEDAPRSGEGWFPKQRFYMWIAEEHEAFLYRGSMGISDIARCKQNVNPV
jgi:hypothetical protein